MRKTVEVLGLGLMVLVFEELWWLEFSIEDGGFEDTVKNEDNAF